MVEKVGVAPHYPFQPPSSASPSTFLQLALRIIPTSPEGHKGLYYDLCGDGESRTTTELTPPPAPVLSDSLLPMSALPEFP